MIRYSVSQLARAFVHLHDKYPMKPLIAALASELVVSGRTVDVDRVMAETARHLLVMRKTLLAQAIVARPLSPANVRAVKKMLAQASGAVTVRLEVQINPAVIGGWVVKTPGLELDASVAGTLKSLMKV